MTKQLYLKPEQIRPLVSAREDCLAADTIVVHGQRIGYMYRDEPQHETDSGWVFLAGVESLDYIDDPENVGIYDLNTIANYDPEIIPLLTAAIGSAYSRNPETGQFEEDGSPPVDQITAKPGSTNPEDPAAQPLFCDQCGHPIEFGECVRRSKTESQMAGAMAVHKAVQFSLCPTCAKDYDTTGDTMVWVMAAFVAVIGAVALAAWVLPLIFR